MSSYDAFFQNRSEEHHQNYLENLEELFYDHPKQTDISYQERKDQHLDPTNFTEKQPSPRSWSTRASTLIGLNKTAINSFVYTKKGRSNQTMQLLPNFKTFIVRKIKELLTIRVLNREQTLNCMNFMRNSPSFQSIYSLLIPVEKCGRLRECLLEMFSSSQIIRELMQSGICMEQKLNLIKYVDRMRDQLENPNKLRRWKGRFP